MLPQFDLDFVDLYSRSSGSIGQTHQFDASIQTPTYQGMSAQVLDTSFPGYHNPSDITKNNPVSFNLLNKYVIEPLTLSGITPETADFFETDIPDIPTSVLDEYIPGNSDNEPVNDAPSPLPLPIPDIPLIQQIGLPGSEPEIRKPIPESHSNPDYPLTNRPDVLSNPQDLRPLTAINPLNLNQTTSEKQTTRAKDIVDDNSSIIERKKSYHRERYKNDPDFAERLKARSRERQRELRKDPAFVERERKRMRELRKNPAFIERRKNRQRELRKDPGFVKRERKRMRELRKDPAFVERERKRQIELRKDPAFVKRKRAQQRERYRNDHDFAERLKANNRERYRNDPDYAERQKASKRERYRNDPDFAERMRKRNNEYIRKLHKDPAVDNGCTVCVTEELLQ